MKTYLYLSTTLTALAIQVMVLGQTENRIASSHIKNSESASSYAVIQERILAPLEGNKETYTMVGNEKKNVLPSDLKLGENHIASLEFKIEEMMQAALKIRASAWDKELSHKTVLLADALKIESQAIQLQLEALEYSGLLNLSKYDKNKERLNKLVNQYNGTQYILGISMNLINNAEMNIKLATEMRQEAYAQNTIAAKVGTLSNAEEKEFLALDQQNHAMGLLDKTQKIAGNVY